MKNQHIGTVATHLVFNAIACYLIAKKCDGFSKAGAVGMLAASAIQCTRKADESLNQKVFYSAASFVILAISFSKLDKKVNFCATLLLGGSHLLIHEFIYKPLEYQDDPSYPQVKAALQIRSTSLKVKRILEQATLQKAGGRHAAAARTLSYALSAAASCPAKPTQISAWIQLASWYCALDNPDNAEAMLAKTYYPFTKPTQHNRTNEMDKVLKALALKLPSKDEQLDRLLELATLTKNPWFSRCARAVAPQCENPEDALQLIWEQEVSFAEASPDWFVRLLAFAQILKADDPKRAEATLLKITPARCNPKQQQELIQERMELACGLYEGDERLTKLNALIATLSLNDRPPALLKIAKDQKDDNPELAKAMLLKIHPGNFLPSQKEELMQETVALTHQLYEGDERLEKLNALIATLDRTEQPAALLKIAKDQKDDNPELAKKMLLKIDLIYSPPLRRQEITELAKQLYGEDLLPEQFKPSSHPGLPGGASSSSSSTSGKASIEYQMSAMQTHKGDAKALKDAWKLMMTAIQQKYLIRNDQAEALLRFAKKLEDIDLHLAIKTLDRVFSFGPYAVSNFTLCQVAKKQRKLCLKLPQEERVSQLLILIAKAPRDELDKLIKTANKAAVTDKDRKRIWKCQIKRIRKAPPSISHAPLLRLAEKLTTTSPQLAAKTLRYIRSDCLPNEQRQIKVLKNALLPRLITEMLNQDTIKAKHLTEFETFMKGNKSPQAVRLQIYNAATRLPDEEKRAHICVALKVAFLSVDATFVDRLTPFTTKYLEAKPSEGAASSAAAGGLNLPSAPDHDPEDGP